MAHKTPSWFQVVLTISTLSLGCAAHPVRAEAPRSPSPVACEGGTVASSSDAARLSGCTAVEGDLRITGSDLWDLTALSTLRSVSGTLTIAENAHLKSLEGLEHLSRAGAVIVTGNPELRTLRGLEGLTRVRSLEIRKNGIHSTAGLEGLRAVRHIVIEDNHKLLSLAGLRTLERAHTVRIERNPLLCAQFGLLGNLTQVEQELLVKSNYGLSAAEVARLQARVRSLSALVGKASADKATDRAYSHLDR